MTDLKAPDYAHALLDKIYHQHEQLRLARALWQAQGNKFSGLNELSIEEAKLGSITNELNTLISQPPPQAEKPFQQEIEESNCSPHHTISVEKTRRKEHVRRRSAEANN